MNNMNELCEKYYWLIDEAINNPNETRVTIKDILAKFAGEVVEPEVKTEVKPTVRAQYVKCEFKVEWEAVRHYNEVGELFVRMNGVFLNVNVLDGSALHRVIDSYHQLYVQVETEIPWLEDATAYAQSCDCVNTALYIDSCGGIDIDGNMTRNELVHYAKLILESCNKG